MAKTYNVLKSKYGLNKYEITTYDNDHILSTTNHKDEVAVMLTKANLESQGFRLKIEGVKPIIYIQKDDSDESVPEEDD